MAILCAQQRARAGRGALNFILQVKVCVSEPPLRLYIKNA